MAGSARHYGKGSNRHDSLPAQLTSFVGRRRELAEVERLLNGQRLVTLTGPAGSGKTRLALEAARRWAERQRRSVCFVDLAAVTDSNEIPEAVAVASGVQSVGRRPIAEVLLLILKDSDGLIIVDNCEHLIDACARVVGLLVQGCPDLRLLCSSRARLRVPGEVHRPLSPLTLPDPRLELDSECASPRARPATATTAGSGGCGPRPGRISFGVGLVALAERRWIGWIMESIGGRWFVDEVRFVWV